MPSAYSRMGGPESVPGSPSCSRSSRGRYGPLAGGRQRLGPAPEAEEGVAADEADDDEEAVEDEALEVVEAFFFGGWGESGIYLSRQEDGSREADKAHTYPWSRSRRRSAVGEAQHWPCVGR